MKEINEQTRLFIRHHAEEDVRQLALRADRHTDVDLPFALDQIHGRQVARKKLPTWAAVDGIVYPPHLSMEQCSSEPTARYKARLAGSGIRYVDLTGGFGVDFSFMSRNFRERIYVEQNVGLCAISSANLPLLGLAATVVNVDAASYLSSMPDADVVFLDPARRDGHGTRTYGIADCTPNVLGLLSPLLLKARRIILKLSPMLDWHKAVGDLQAAAVAACRGGVSCPSVVREVHIVALHNECKELLLVCSLQEPPSALRLVCVNLKSDSDLSVAEHFVAESDQSLQVASLKDSDCPFDSHKLPLLEPQVRSGEPVYLFEPNASMMKAGCFDLLSERFAVTAIAPNSHLFISAADRPDFPGRRFRISAVLSMNRKQLRQTLAGIDRANVAVRNFPISAASLRQRLKLRDGGDVYLFATTLSDGSHCLFVCKKAKS